MRVAAVFAHGRGGVVNAGLPIVDAWKAIGHDVETYMGARGTHLDLREFNHVHAFNIDLLPYITYGDTISCTFHHMTLGYEKGYMTTLGMYPPTLIHVFDKWAIRQLGRYGIYNVMYVPYCIRPMPYYDKYPEKFVIGCLGGDSTYKRFDVIREIAEEAGVECIIHDNDVDGWISDEAIKDIYKRITVYVVASFEDAGPLPALEALHCGRLVLSTYVGALADWDRGIRHFDGSVADGVKQLNKLREDMVRVPRIPLLGIPPPAGMPYEYDNLLKRATELNGGH